MFIKLIDNVKKIKSKPQIEKLFSIIDLSNIIKIVISEIKIYLSNFFFLLRLLSKKTINLKVRKE